MNFAPPNLKTWLQTWSFRWCVLARWYGGGEQGSDVNRGTNNAILQWGRRMLSLIAHAPPLAKTNAQEQRESLHTDREITDACKLVRYMQISASDELQDSVKSRTSGRDARTTTSQ